MRLPRLLTCFLAVSALVIGTVVPATAATASVSASGSSTSRMMSDPASSGIAKTSLAGFNAGNIISDAVFTNKSTMTEAQIQAFFNSKVSSCQSGYVCIKDFRITSVTRPADAYCKGYSGEANESAARIIYRVAQSCNINPQVLIVMLQKEQGLITHTWPSAWRYNIALGQGCPDTAPCDPNYIGFFHQIYGAARQMQIYMEGKWFQWYAPGRTWNILYNPNASCGSSPVYIANKATSALYYYTPYQPNAAAMRAGYGEGDGCSAYGNRNFYNYFTDWFGSANATSAQVLRDSGSGATYLVSQGKKYSFPTSERAVQFTWVSPVQAVPTAQLAAYADAGIAPRAVRTDAGNVYLLDSGRRIWIPSCGRAADYGWDCGSLPMVGQAQVAIYGDGGALEPSITALGTSWLVQGSSRREIVDRSLLLQFGITTGATNVADAMASEYKLGDPVFGAGVYSDGSGGMRAILQNGGVYDISPQGQVPAVNTAAKRISKETWARLKSAGTLPLSVKAGGGTYLLSTGGWLQVDAYGSLIGFADVPVGSMAGLPSAGSALGAHFVREQSSIQVFLVSGGTIQTVSAEQQRSITATFGVSPVVRVVADTALGSRVGPTQRMVRVASGSAYLIDGTNRYRFRDCGQVSDWGADCNQLPTTSASELGQYTDRGVLERLVRLGDNTTWLVQSGLRRELPDAAVLAPFGIGSATSSVSTALGRSLTVGAPVLGTGVFTDGAGGFLLSNPAGTFRIPTGAQVSIVTQGARRLTAESVAFMPPRGDLGVRMLSDGRSLLLTDDGWLQVDPGLYGGAKAFPAADPGVWSGIPLVINETRPHFVKDRSSTQTFLVSGGVLQPVENDAARTWLAAYFGLSSRLWSLADGALRGITLAPGTIIKTTDSRYVVTDGTTAYQLLSCTVVAAFGKDCGSLSTVRMEALGLKDGGSIGSLLRGPGGDIWLIQSGTRREVPDTAILAAFGIGSASSAVSNELLKTLRLGDPVIASGAYRSPSGAMRLTAAGGIVLDIPVAAQVEAFKTSAKPLSEESFALLKPSGTLPVRAATGGASYVLSAQGWARVDAANYGSLTFPSVAAAVVAAPAGPAATGARFVRETNSAQVYLASGGLTPMTAEQQAWAVAVYGVPATVVVVADGAIR